MKRRAPVLKLISTPELAHPYQVVREDGLPDVVLTLFAEDLLKSLSPSSVPIYMREVVSAFNWAVVDKVVAQNQWSLFGAPAEVRNVVRQYLTVGAKCKLRRRPDRLGVQVTYVHPTDDTRINVRIFLAALRRFYAYLIAEQRYQHPNPLVHEDMSRVAAELRQNYRRAIKDMEGREPMPAASGVDPPSGIRLSANYFRCVDEEWLPKTIDDPDFPHLVYNAGKQRGWGLRELCVVRILFESGARISEVFDLTARDWAVSQFLNVFEARNKGSFGVRTKRLVVSSVTAKLCRRYFDDDKDGRRAHDPQRLTIAELSKLDGPALERVKLFLSQRHHALYSKSFRAYYWNRTLRSVGIQANPHLARHWFVTNALRTIEQTSKDANEILRRKTELVQYMAWRTAERTLKAYEHVVRDDNFVATTLQTIHRTMKQREEALKRDPSLLSQRLKIKPSASAEPHDEEWAILTGGKR
jgi:Phage integrase family